MANMKKALLILAAVLVASAAMLSSCGNRNAKNTETDMTSIQEEPIYDIVTSMGTIRVKLYSKTPNHRDNFAKLAADHFYDSLLFHRVINHFMIQAGDPLTRDTSRVAEYGTGGPGYTVPAEFVKEYYHKKGALAAARRGDFANPTKASSGSQFYIVQDEDACLPLDDQYTVFGETIEGLEVIDRIAAVETDRYDRPLEDVRILAVNLVEEQPQEPVVEDGAEDGADE